MGDSGSFWGTVVQVIPVMFIGVMIEFRYLLGRSAKNDARFRATRRVRAFTASLLLIVSVMLTIAFALGIRGLRGGIPTTDASAGVAVLSLSLAGGVAIGTPGVLLFVASTSDIWLLLYRKLPWSKVSRGEREVQRGRVEDARLRREAVGIRHEFLMNMSAAYIVASFYDRRIPTMRAEDQPKARVVVDEMYARADQARKTLRSLDDVINAPQDWPQIARITENEVAFIRAQLTQEIERLSG